MRKQFTFNEFIQDCELLENCHEIEGRKFGLKVFIPDDLKTEFPYSASAYDFMQFFRKEILQWGTIEFPGLPVNPKNHTVALRAPKEHSYSSNPFLTESCQRPHQDTPPYPTAFWLNAKRRFYASWVMAQKQAEEFFMIANQSPQLSIDEIHQQLVRKSLKNKTGILLNHDPGLLLIDNSPAHNLYHARTCNFSAVEQNPNYQYDEPLYAFNEVGLMNYIDTIDSRRGQQHRDSDEKNEVVKFMNMEKSGRLF